MAFKPSVLNVSTGLLILWNITFTIVNYKELASGEGWGVVAMAGIFIFSIVLLFVDFLIRSFFKSKWAVNIIGSIVVIIAAFFLFRYW